MKRLFVLLAALSLAACASGARDVEMSAPAATTTQASANSPLQNAIAVGAVTGGKDTLPFWKSEVGDSKFESALKISLGNAGLLAKDAGKYRLDVQLVDLDQPFISFNTTVTSTVHYTLTELASSKTTFDQTIKADYEAKLIDSPLGFMRLRLANEGSIRHNIELFMQQLMAAPAP